MDLAEKLSIKPAARVLLMNAPIGTPKKLEPLPSGATVTNRESTPDVTIAFVRDTSELRRIQARFPELAEDGVLWVCFPHGGAKAGTDLDPDALNAALAKQELSGVSLVPFDDTWSCAQLQAREDEED